MPDPTPDSTPNQTSPPVDDPNIAYVLPSHPLAQEDFRSYVELRATLDAVEYNALRYYMLLNDSAERRAMVEELDGKMMQIQDELRAKILAFSEQQNIPFRFRDRCCGRKYAPVCTQLP